MKIAIIGAGAAGYFAALSAKNSFPECDVQVFEKTGKVLSKVKISGGDNCWEWTAGCGGGAGGPPPGAHPRGRRPGR
jgi:succinate dehydrogenase/fumarate reductase flavoprotein subunit